MLNWFRTLTESDKRRLRRLERLVDDLSADVGLLQERVVRSEARQRARSRRQLETSDTEGQPVGSADDVGPGHVDPQAQPGPEQLNGEDRTVTRETLRARFNAKFGRRA